MRGDRTVPSLDLNTADWVVSGQGTGVKRLLMSRDPQTGAFTQALYAPPGFATDEQAHFADTDMDIFMYEGEFAFDQITPLREGDYLYRPAGTVYGDGERSDAGGTMIISFGRESVKFHLEDPPDPWPGEYLVDRLWNDREAQPMYVRTAGLPWTRSPIGYGVEEKRLRGVPGQRSTTSGATSASPWAADAAFLLKLPAGYRGPFPQWEGFQVELLALSGRATIDDQPWARGSYTFGALTGETEVDEDLVLYGRCFAGD
jgi:hypothetical protein